jgi:hypothetical protein
MAYYQATNTGKGFITHPENESAHVAGYPGNVWVTENSAWASRVGAVSKTKVEAQLLVNNALLGKLYPEEHENAGQQVVLNLP